MGAAADTARGCRLGMIDTSINPPHRPPRPVVSTFWGADHDKRSRGCPPSGCARLQRPRTAGQPPMSPWAAGAAIAIFTVAFVLIATEKLNRVAVALSAA